jgi:hypothetical protein
MCAEMLHLHPDRRAHKTSYNKVGGYMKGKKKKENSGIEKAF